MKVFGIAGWSGSGKTTLLTRLLPVLVGRGIRVATLKHTHHVPEWGDEEARLLRAAGAAECLIASPRRFALLHEVQAEEEADSPESLIGRFSAVDLLLIEGLKRASHPKLEVWDGEDGNPLTDIGNRNVKAVVGIVPPPNCGLPFLHRDDLEGIADFVCGYCDL